MSTSAEDRPGESPAPERLGLASFLALGLALIVAVVVPTVFGDAPQDDAYISYRYAQNLANGDGLVFNPGEPAVEGYTNFLWTLAIGAGLRAGLDPEVVVPWVGLGCTLLCVLATFALGRQLGSAAAFAALGALLFASRPMLAVHAMGGLETPFFGALIAFGLLARFREAGQTERSAGGRSAGWGSAFVFALAALTRPEGVLVFGLLELYELAPALARPAELGPAIARRIRRGLPFLAIVSAHVAWRRATYGDWVPNTFHAKVEAGPTTWGDGLRYVGLGIAYFGPLFFLAPYVSGAPRSATPSARRRRAICLWISTVYVLYVIYAGGDYIPSYRFLWPVMPLWCALLAVAVTRWTTDAAGRARPLMRAVVAALFVALIGVQTTLEYRFGHRWAGMDVRHERLVAAGRLLNDALPPGAWIAVTNAGRLPYFAERPTLDMMGLSDLHIARSAPMEATPELAGHLKGDGGYVLDCTPDAILFLRLVVMERPLAKVRDWRDLAARMAFGISERQIAADRRLASDYRVFSLPLGQESTGRRIWLNLFGRADLFADDPPPGLLVAPSGS